MITYPTNKLQKVLLSGGCEQNGTPTPDAPMDIVCNNGVVKVSSNLFNATWEQGAISGKLNKTYEEAKEALTNRIRIVNEIYLDYTKTYTISINNPDLEFVIQVFDSQHRLYNITNVSNVWGTSPKTFTGAYGIAIALRYKTQVDILPTEGQNAKVQLELGSVATSYMPYGIYTDGTQEVVTDSLGNTATAEMLLAVNDYKDTQSVLDGKVTRNVWIKVLDGTENWMQHSSYNDIQYFDLSNSPKLSATAIPSTHYVGTSVANSDMPTNSIKITTRSGSDSGSIFVKSEYTSTDGLKQFLAEQYANGTPVIIVYPLETPTTETVTPQPLAGNTATVTAGSIDNLPIESSTIAELKKRYIGNNEVNRVYIGNNLVWENN